MKLNITIEPANLNGYQNISPLKGDSLVPIDVADNSCEEIIVETIDYIPCTQVYDTLSHYISKLRHQGIITIIGTQVDIILNKYTTRQISLDELNKGLFGANQHPWDNKRSMNHIHLLNNILKKHNLMILEQHLDQDKFIIKGKRL